jgi:hypothetical protein
MRLGHPPARSRLALWPRFGWRPSACVWSPCQRKRPWRSAPFSPKARRCGTGFGTIQALCVQRRGQMPPRPLPPSEMQRMLHAVRSLGHPPARRLPGKAQRHAQQGLPVDPSNRWAVGRVNIAPESPAKWPAAFLLGRHVEPSTREPNRRRPRAGGRGKIGRPGFSLGVNRASFRPKSSHRHNQNFQTPRNPGWRTYRPVSAGRALSIRT